MDITNPTAEMQRKATKMDVAGSTTEVQRMRRVTIKAGIYTALGLIFYFLLMRLFNLHKVMQLQYFNIVVLLIGLRYVIKNIKFITGEIKYFEGLKAGLLVTIMSVLIFNIFMLIYETVIDPPFLDFLKENISFGKNLSTWGTVINVMGLLMIEGLSSGFIITYMLMQYYKAESSETK